MYKGWLTHNRYTYVLHLLDAGKKRAPVKIASNTVKTTQPKTNNETPVVEGKIGENELQKAVRQIFMRIGSRDHTKEVNNRMIYMTENGFRAFDNCMISKKTTLRRKRLYLNI